MTEYTHTFSVRLLDDATAFRITYWRPVSAPRNVKGRPRLATKLPMPRHRGRTLCPTSGKLRYGTFETAQHALAVAGLSHSPRRRETRSYRCDDCGSYHLTSKP